MLRFSNIVSGIQSQILMQPRFVRIVEAVLVIVLAVVVGKMITDYLSYGESANSMPAKAGSSVSENSNIQLSSKRQNEPSGSLLSLFGSAQVSIVDTQQDYAEIQETQLKLILRGVMVNQQTNQRLALIAVPGNVEKVYSVGDEVEGARIIRVEPGRIVLNHNGKDEALYLSIPKMTADEENAGSKSRTISSGNGIRKINDTRRIVSQATLRQQLNNLPSLLRQAKAVPHSENGENLGFKMVEVQAGSIFEDLGLQKDDIIQTVNGTSVRSAEDALNAYRRLRTSRSFQLSLLRNGRPVSLDLSVQ